MSVSIIARQPHAHAHPELGFLRKYIFSTDHKIIGIQFLFSGADLPGPRRPAGAAGAHPARLAARRDPDPRQAGSPDSWRRRMPPEFYNMLFSMHATVMIFFVIIPLLTGAFGNFLIPLMIGAKDMAFPKLNMMSYWFMWPAFVMILRQLLRRRRGGRRRLDRVSDAVQRHHAGRARASSRRPRRTPAWARSSGCSSLLFVGISSMMGSVNYITTIINMRAPGMTLFRMPMTIWAMFITAILQAFALPVLTVALILQLLDKTIGTDVLPAARRR